MKNIFALVYKYLRPNNLGRIPSPSIQFQVGKNGEFINMGSVPGADCSVDRYEILPNGLLSRVS